MFNRLSRVHERYRRQTNGHTDRLTDDDITNAKMKNPEFSIFACFCNEMKQDAQLLQRDRATECVIVFAKSRRLELGDNILRTL